MTPPRVIGNPHGVRAGKKANGPHDQQRYRSFAVVSDHAGHHERAQDDEEGADAEEEDGQKDGPDGNLDWRVVKLIVVEVVAVSREVDLLSHASILDPAPHHSRRSSQHLHLQHA